MVQNNVVSPLHPWIPYPWLAECVNGETWGYGRPTIYLLGKKHTHQKNPHISKPVQSKPTFLQGQVYFTKKSTYIVGAEYIYFNTQVA